MLFFVKNGGGGAQESSKNPWTTNWFLLVGNQLECTILNFKIAWLHDCIPALEKCTCIPWSIWFTSTSTFKLAIIDRSILNLWYISSIWEELQRDDSLNAIRFHELGFVELVIFLLYSKVNHGKSSFFTTSLGEYFWNIFQASWPCKSKRTVEESHQSKWNSWYQFQLLNTRWAPRGSL